MVLQLFFLLFFHFIHKSALASNDTDLYAFCPKLCQCSMANKSTTKGLAVKCQGELFKVLDYSTFLNISKELVEELDLSGNGIQSLLPNIFKGFSYLRKLILSENSLRTIYSAWFEGLERLEKLSLANNLLKFVPERSFESLRNLKFLDLSSPYLTCDCRMKWFRRWITGKRSSGRHLKVALTKGTVCNFPARLRGQAFAEIRRKDLTCGGRLDPASFTTEPATNRFVAQGDAISLKCDVSTMADDEILEWVHNDTIISPFSNYERSENHYDGGRRHVNEIRIKALTINDSGNWTCRLETSKGTVEKSILLYVLRNLSDTKCIREALVEKEEPLLFTDHFPRHNISLCHAEQETAINASQSFENDDVLSTKDPCNSLISDRLKELNESFETGNMRQEGVFLLEELANATADLLGTELCTPTAEDVHLLLLITERAMLGVQKVARIMTLADIINTFLKMKPSLLNLANRFYDTTRRLHSLVKFLSPTVGLSEFAMKECPVAKIDDSTIAAIYNDSALVGTEFGCVRGHRDDRSVFEASVSMEITVNFASELKSSTLVIPVRFFWYRNSESLSDVVSNNETVGDREWITIGSAIGVTSSPSTDISMFMNNVSAGDMLLRWKLSPKRDVDLREIRLAVLKPNFDKGFMQWTPMLDCRPAAIIRRTTVLFSCPLSLGSFTLIRRKSDWRSRVDWSVFLGPWTLAASGFCAVCFLMAVCLQIYFRRMVRSSVKLRHALVNCWLSLTILILSFALGIDHVENEILCLVIAITLHYITLVVILWIFLVSRILQRKLQKVVYPKKLNDSDDEMTSYGDGIPKPRHGPLVGMYFFAWGLPGMPCAFTLPLRMDSYTTNANMCFMEANFIALMAFAIPALLFIIVTVVLLFRGFHLQNILQKQWRLRHTPGSDVIVNQDETNILCETTEKHCDTRGEVDAVSCVSTEIGVAFGGPKKHLNAISMLFAMVFVAYGLAALYVLRPWKMFFFNYDFYFMCSISGLYAFAMVTLGITVIRPYILSYLSASTRSVIPEKSEKRRSGTFISPTSDVEVVVARKAPRNRKKLTSATDTFMDNVEHQQTGASEMAINSFDSSMVLSSDRRTVNAGTSMTRPPSELSASMARSGTNVSTARSQRIQQAAAKKYYQKQRASKVNTSDTANEDSEVIGLANGGKSDVLEKEKEMRVSLLSSSQQIAEDSSDIADDSYHRFRHNKDSEYSAGSDHSKNICSTSMSTVVENRRPSVELYRKPSSVATKFMDVALNVPISSKRQSGSDEDSTPEALRNFDSCTGSQRFGASDSPSGTINGNHIRVCGKTETPV